MKLFNFLNIPWPGQVFLFFCRKKNPALPGGTAGFQTKILLS